VSDPSFDPPLLRQQAIYWNQLVQLKTLATYIRLYRDDQARWVNLIGIVRAMASSSTIAGWVIWKDYAAIWGVVLAVSQAADALKEFLPNAKRQQAAGEMAMVLETLFIDSQFDWEVIFTGEETSGEIMHRYRKLAKLKLDAEKKYFPHGVPTNLKLYELASQETNEYVLATYGEKIAEGGLA